jgi:hypothetical protein
VPPRTDKGQKPRPCTSQALADRIHFPLASDQRRGLQGQVVRVGLKRPQGRELGGQVGNYKLEDPFRPREVLEIPLPEVPQLGVRRQLIFHQLLGDGGEEYLPAVGGIEQPRHPVERGAEVVSVSLDGSPCVQCHAHPQGARLLPPGLREEGSLGRERRLECAEGVGEGRAESISHRLEVVTAVAPYSAPQEIILSGEGGAHRLGALLPHLARALDVREQEGYRAAGRYDHALRILLLPGRHYSIGSLAVRERRSWLQVSGLLRDLLWRVSSKSLEVSGRPKRSMTQSASTCARLRS